MLISVITPNFNQGKFLPKNLASVAGQDHPLIEHIVLDAESTDSSIEVIQAHRTTKTFVWVSEPDSGQSDAINKGFRMASGEILCWLNSDDWYANPQVLSRVAAEFARHPDVDVVYGRGNYCNVADGSEKPAWMQDRAEDLPCSLIWCVGIIQPAVFFRSSVIDSIGVLDVSNHTAMDYDYWIRLARAGHRFKFLDAVLAQAGVHEGAKSLKHRSRQLEESLLTSFRHYGAAHPRWINVSSINAETADSQFFGNVNVSQLPPETQARIDERKRERFCEFNRTAQAIDVLMDPRYCEPKLAQEYFARYLPDWEAVRANRTPVRRPVAGREIDVLYHPAFTDPDEFRDQLKRASWSLPATTGVITKFLLQRGSAVATQWEKTPAAFGSLPANFGVAVIDHGSEFERRLVKQARFLAVWRNFAGSPIHATLEQGQRMAMLDKHDRSRREAFEYCKLLHDVDWSRRAPLLAESRDRFQRVAARLPRLRKAYVFCTGPSLKEAWNHDFSDGLRIICNSMVNDWPLLDHIKPHLLAAADPVFHFGVSPYAADFRARLEATILHYQIPFFHPFFFGQLFEAQFPHLRPWSIAVPQAARPDFNLDLRADFMVRGIDNIMTLLLMPLATTFADEIVIIGSDGRKPDDTKFWQHDTKSQFYNQMSAAQATHPGFFDHCDYVDYYERHCRALDEMIRQAEASGKTVRTLTKSMVPCLAARPASSLAPSILPPTSAVP